MIQPWPAELPVPIPRAMRGHRTQPCRRRLRRLQSAPQRQEDPAPSTSNAQRGVSSWDNWLPRPWSHTSNLRLRYTATQNRRLGRGVLREHSRHFGRACRSPRALASRGNQAYGRVQEHSQRRGGHQEDHQRLTTQRPSRPLTTTTLTSRNDFGFSRALSRSRAADTTTLREETKVTAKQIDEHFSAKTRWSGCRGSGGAPGGPPDHHRRKSMNARWRPRQSWRSGARAHQRERASWGTSSPPAAC